MSSAATLSVDNGIARLVMDRPPAAALNGELAAALRESAESLVDRDDVRVVVLSSTGKLFSAGGDLSFVSEHPDGPRAALDQIAGDLHAALIALSTIDAPVIARVHGAAGGAGLSMICAADLSIGVRSCSLSVAYTRAGLSPDGGLTWLLPRIVGHRRATELMLTNRAVKADEAQALGLLTEVVDDEQLDERVEELAAQIASSATTANGAVKRLLRESATATFEQQLQSEGASIAALSETPAGREGVAAFLEKRSPDFAASA